MFIPFNTTILLICAIIWCIRFGARRKNWIEDNVITANTEEPIYECYVFSVKGKNTANIYHETICLERLKVVGTHIETVEDCQELIDEFKITQTLGEKIICKRYFISGTYYLHDGKISTNPKDLFAYR
jgi:acetone carboxylase gamma subunit